MSHVLHTTSEYDGFFSGDRASWVLTAVFSALCHIVLIAAAAWIGDLMPRRVIPPEIISVNMVSTPSHRPAKTPPAREPTVIRPEDLVRPPAPAITDRPPAPVNESTPAHEPVVKPAQTVVVPDTRPEPEKLPATAPAEPAVPKKITALKPKAAAKPGKSRRKALSPENVRKESLKAALEKLRRENENRISPSPAARSSAGGVSSPPGTGASAGISDIYKAQLISRILGNWTAPEQLLHLRRDLTAVISVQLAPNGGIRHMEMRHRSGNPHLDDTAWRAVLKASPFPPPPEHMPPDTLFTFRFTPLGLQQ